MILDTAKKPGKVVTRLPFSAACKSISQEGQVGRFVHCLCLRDYHSLCNNHGTIPCVVAHLPCKFYTMLAYNYGHPTLLLLHTPNISNLLFAPSRPQNLIISFLLIMSNFDDVTIFVYQKTFHLSTCQDIIIFAKFSKEKEKEIFSQVESYLVFIRVLSFLGQRLKSIHALFYFCLSFLDLLGQVMHFSKFSFANLINAYFKLL